MRKLLFSLVFFLLLQSVNAAVTSINSPANNDIISYSYNVELNVSASGSTDCIFFYSTESGLVPINQSVNCDGMSLVTLPNYDGVYNITVQDDAGSSVANTIRISKPSGILVTAIYVLSFFILLGMLFLFILILAKFAMLNTTVYDIAYSWTFYFGLQIAYILNKEYTGVPFVLRWLEMIMTAAGYLLVIFPLVAFFITFIKKGFDKKNVPSPQEITGRGRFLNV